MKNSRKDLINFSLEKNNYHPENSPCNKPNKETYDNQMPSMGNHLFNKYKNFANELKRSTENPKFLKNNNSAADLHNLKKNLGNNKRKNLSINNSVFISSPKNEHNLTKIRENSNLNRSPAKLSNSRHNSNINSNLFQQNERRKESIDKSKKSNSLLKTQSIDYSSTAWDIKKICNKEILKLQKNNRNCNEILHSPTAQSKSRLFEDRPKYNSIKKSAQYTMNSSYATIDSNKSTYIHLITQNSSKIKENRKDNAQHIAPKCWIKTNLQKNITHDIDMQQKLKLRQKIIQPMNFSPKNKQAKEMKINESEAFDCKPNHHTTNNKTYLDNSKTNISSSKISLDKNFTIERLKSKINKKFTSFNKSKFVNKISSEKNGVREDKKGTIINISNNINNNFHIMINHPHHNANKSNLDQTLSKISTQPDLFNTKKNSLGDNILSKSNLRFKSNLSSLKELTNITQKFKNFYPGNISFSKITELKRTKDKNHKIEDECQDIRVKSDLGDTMRVDSKYDEELEEILMENEFIEKENSTKTKKENVEKVKKNKIAFYNDVRENVKNRQEKNSVSEDIFNLYLNKNLHKQEKNEKNKKIILKNKDFYSNESSNNNLGSINAKKQSESGSLLSDESIFDISKIKKKLDKKAKNDTNELSNKLSQSMKISSESNDKKSSLSKEKSSSNKDLLDVSLSYNVSDEEEFHGQCSKNSGHPIKNNNEYDFDEFKNFYDEMNKKLLTYK